VLFAITLILKTISLLEAAINYLQNKSNIFRLLTNLAVLPCET